MPTLARTTPPPVQAMLLALFLLLLPLGVLAGQTVTVHKSPACGCCELWLDQLSTQGYDIHIEHPEDLNAVKAQHGIAPVYQSCHTAVSEDGFVFEGHIPGFLISRFLAEPPQGAIGLAVPGMPIGSPGMEIGDRFDPYEVLLLMADGSSQVYARIDNPAQQAGPQGAVR